MLKKLFVAMAAVFRAPNASRTMLDEAAHNVPQNKVTAEPVIHDPAKSWNARAPPNCCFPSERWRCLDWRD
jgi:hypothetical protein